MVSGRAPGCDKETLRSGFFLCLEDVFATLRIEYDALETNEMLSKLSLQVEQLLGER